MKKTAELTTEYLGELLSGKGVKPSFQRLSVLKYLMVAKNHPSVDHIYQAIHKDIPTLSKTTVYNTLNLLVEKGIVSALGIKEGEVLYDYIEEPHAHFQCLNCGCVKDIMIGSDLLKLESLNGLTIQSAQINFKGFCDSCSK